MTTIANIAEPDGVKGDSASSPLKILHTEWSNGFGGQEIRILREMQALAKRGGFEFELACRPDAEISEKARMQGIAVHHLPFGGRMDRGTITQLKRLIRIRHIHCVHTHSSVDAYLGGMAARLTGIPVVRSRHLSFQSLSPFKARLLYRWLADVVVCSSSVDAELLQRAGGLTREQALFVRAGDDPNRLWPDGKRPAPARPNPDPNDSPVIGLLGMLRREKGQDTLIEAIHLLQDSHPNIRVMLVGDGPSRNRLQSKIDGVGLGPRIKITGYQGDIAPWLAAMDLCVVPSRQEAFPQVISQILLTETPMLAAAVGDIPRVLEAAGLQACLFESHPDGLAAAIRHALSQRKKWQALARRGRAWALANLTFDAQVQQMADIYQALIQGRS